MRFFEKLVVAYFFLGHPVYSTLIGRNFLDDDEASKAH